MEAKINLEYLKEKQGIYDAELLPNGDLVYTPIVPIEKIVINCVVKKYKSYIELLETPKKDIDYLSITRDVAGV